MNEKRLYVKLLGEFSVWYGDERVNLGRSSTGRSAQLFQLLMLSPGYQISKEKLMADLYKSGEYSNKNNGINNIVCRLRKILAQAGLPGDEHIAIENGNCIWKSQIPVTVDAARFCSLIDESTRVQGEDRLRLLREAWVLYRGPILASNSIEEWAIPETLQYRELYHDCTKQIACLLKANECWEDMYTLYTTAAAIEPYEEWQLGRLDSLIAMGEYEKAFQVYEKEARACTEVSDQPISREMMERARKISQHLKGGYEDLDDIQFSLSEANRKSKERVYECPYPNFMDVYCSLKRISARSQIRCCLMQLTVVNRKKLPVQKAAAAKKGKLLGDAIKNTLRYGDIFTQYNTARFLLILNHTRKEDGKVVFRRIAQDYENQGGSRRDIDYQIVPMYED